MITGVNHIGIAVENLEDVKKVYNEVLKNSKIHEETIEEQKSKVLSYIVGETHIEFLEPTSADSPIAKFIEKKGQGIHHIAFTTDDINNDMQNLKDKNFRFIDEIPRNGMNNTKIAFLHPKSTSSVLVELCQES